MIDALQAAHRAGIGADAALEMTPFLLSHLLEAEADHIRANQRWDMFEAHQLAVLMRSGKLPTLKTFLAPFDDNAKPETDHEQTARSLDQTLRTVGEQREAARTLIRERAKALAEKRRAAKNAR